MVESMTYYGFTQHALVQPTAQAFFLAQQGLVHPAAQPFFAQQGLLQPAEQPSAFAAQELRAIAETATTDIRDRLWITFFISFLFVVGCEAGLNRQTSTPKSL